jgi:hypothetical protein
MATKTDEYRVGVAECAKLAPHASERNGTSTGMVRVIVKLRPEQYDKLVRHVREVGSTMSAFCRESAVKAMREDDSDTDRGRP